MKKLLLSCLVSMLCGVGNMWASDFEETVNEIKRTNYSTDAVVFSTSAIANQLGITANDLVTAFSNNATTPIVFLNYNGNLSSSYDAGQGGFWMATSGAASSWSVINDSGDKGWFNTFEMNADNTTFFIGQFPNRSTVGDSYTAHFVIKVNSNQTTIDITLNIVSDPYESFSLSQLSVTDGGEVVCEEYPKSDRSNETFTYNISAASAATGLTDLQENFQNYIYVKDFDSQSNVTRAKTADGSGWWFNPIDTETHLGECASKGYDGNGRFFAAGFTFDGTNMNFYAGQMPNALSEGNSVYAYVYIVNPNTKAAYRVKVTLDIIENPAFHPVLADLTVTEGPEIVIDQLPRNDWSNTTFSQNISSALTTLGVSAESLTNDIQSMLFTTDKSDPTKLTFLKTADGTGWWFTPLDVEAKGECGSHVMEADSRVFMAGFAFDGTNLTGYVGQNAYNIPTPGDSYFAYVYIVNGTIAYRVKITLNIITPTVDWVETQEIMPTAYGVTNVNLTRTFYSGWNTLVLPFDVNMSELNASDKNLGGGIVEAGVFNSDNIDGQDVIHILFEKISETTGTIPANTPFMLFFDDSDEEMTLTFNNVNVNVVDVPTTPGTNFDFVGTYVQGELIGANDYYVGKENSFWKSNRTRTTKGFRAFLKAKSEGAPARIAFEFDNGEATAIQTLDGEELNAEQSEWYTLAGQRIAAPAHRGLYIKNGKKYFVK